MSTIESSSTAVLYCRYSSHAQRDVSIDQQIKACEAYAKRESIQIVRVYADRAMTGTNDRRPQFQRMLEEAPALGVQYVIVYSLDRFARDRYDSAVNKRELKHHGIRVISATENISDDPTGILMESMFEGWAEYYSAELGRKIGRGLRYNAEHGLVTGPCPYGYRANNGKYEIVPEQAEVIREVYRRTLDGESRVSIIDDLNARKIPTRLGGVWKRTSLEPILKNEKYTGVYLYGDIRIENAMPQIIDRETFDAMQAVLARQANPGAPIRRKTDGGVYLLTGRVFCGHCGSPMVGLSGKSRSGELHYYYVCKGHRYAKTCDKAAIRRDVLEREVAAAIQRHILTDDMIAEIAELSMQQQREAESSAPIVALNAERAAAQKSLDNIMKAIEQGIITVTTKARLEELELELSRIDAELAAERYARKAAKSTKEEVTAALRLYQRGDIDDPEYRETLIDTFVKAVYVYDDKFKIIFHLGNGKNKQITLPAETSNVRINSTNAHHNGLIRTEATIVAVDFGIFMLTCPR